MTIAPSPILPESRNHRFYPALDGLRTIAVAMVVLTHYVPEALPFGWMGVQLFFVLSGFLITGILFETRSDVHRFRNFYARRSLRIFPLYYGFLAAVFLPALLSHAHVPALYALWFVYLQNFFWLFDRGVHADILRTGGGHPIAAIGHLWSLALEEQFYLLWPLVVFAARRRVRLMQVCFGLIVLRILLACYWQLHLSAQTLSLGVTYRMLPTQCDAFLMGGLLALWFAGEPGRQVRRLAGSLAVVAIVSFGALLAALHLHPAFAGDSFDYRSAFQATIGLPLTNLVCTVVLLAVIEPGSWLYRLCHLGFMRSLGKVSYGLYVFHLPAYVFFSGFVMTAVSPHRRANELVFATLTTVALSYASFYLYERPFLLLKNRFTSARRQTPRVHSDPVRSVS